MKVLVTGGTGFVGQAVLRELQSAGHQIHLLARNPESPRIRDVATRYSAKIRRGDVLDSTFLVEACAQIDAVIHLVGIISEVGRQTFERVHTDGTRNMVEASQRTAVKRFLHMSALGARPNALARYHRSKWAGEEIVRQSGLDWTIFRPSIIYGPGDSFVNLFAKIVHQSPIVPIFGSGESKFQPVFVGHVATAFVKALAERHSVGETYNLTGREVFTLNQIVDDIVAALKRKRLILHLPLPLARVQAAGLEILFGRLLHQPSPLNRDQILMLQEDNVGDGKPADDLFGLKHGSFQSGIADYLK